MLNDRLINLVNFLPDNYAGTQVEQFMKFFEDFLNLNLFKQEVNGNDEQFVSILKKIELLFTLRDPDLIDYKMLQFFAEYLGYNINYSKEDVSKILSVKDNITDEEDINNYLRETIRSLPHFYKLKTTQSSLSMIMYLFGIVSDVYTLWTNDYEENWIVEIPPYETEQSNTKLPDGYYPTPHFKISIDISKTDNDFENEISKIISLVESIKPINAVFDGFDLTQLFKNTVNINTITVYHTTHAITETITPS